ncbi:hypothetical protein AJ85_10835 [Alkalihalobacillus alcalophilus ATCC 27647 = CGMCC 1.3604]|uniref:Amidohydrolase 3 domain-containing protein n=1 Tax=Alkalihalobacillus alcalophilus ATCC 27647 = CGMCC 1.3604 TaxID=1218173 RepID=A0A094WL40_ALKAL|nr:amidohydrolase family protein [Alkalihalobacillus alcalophilus]KGA97581.1 hypothetical protein BALCAV_0209520 [Alkalihalobacillus alcalophilus ATCC 27647 = CGMCC 1.3604]MED1563374.1 amidohydrolase family protein [Alkalihalobacillus alcalophilus]THG90412.1 hypothetical protein AJ85_10835 [Alkalihalobacillus alcalophilus ATCC 27647 = CGMCC 1.3604]
MYDLIVKNACTLQGDKGINLFVQNGKIEQMDSKKSVEEESKRVIDAKGRLVLPPFIESHIHLDTALTYGKPAVNPTGELIDGIKLWGQYQEQYLTTNDVYERAKQVINLMISHGVLYMRSMVDVTAKSLTALETLKQLQEEVAPYFHLQIIAFPQLGLTSGSLGYKRMKEAMLLGVDGVSAVPHLEATREKGIESLHHCFQMAKEIDGFVHIFCDETDDSESRYLEVVADLAIEYEWYEKVTVSHINAMAYYNEPYVQKLLNLIAQSKINVVTCPLINSVMMARNTGWPKGRGITRVKDLLGASVNVAVAHDDLMSPFYPLGTGSPLLAGHMLLHLAQMTGSDDFNQVIDMMTMNAAHVLGLNNYGLKIGDEASFLICPAESAHELLRNHPKPSYVILKGQVIAQTEPEQTTWFL